MLIVSRPEFRHGDRNVCCAGWEEHSSKFMSYCQVHSSMLHLYGESVDSELHFKLHVLYKCLQQSKTEG